MEVLQKMGKYTGITSEAAVPMDSSSYLPINKRPPVTAQIVIGTPGTIKKWMSLRKLSGNFMKILVFDEADHMLAEVIFFSCHLICAIFSFVYFAGKNNPYNDKLRQKGAPVAAIWLNVRKKNKDIIRPGEHSVNIILLTVFGYVLPRFPDLYLQDGFKDDSLRIMKDIERFNSRCQVYENNFAH